MNTQHQPVLLDAVIQVLSPKIGECFIDGTAGYGGHAAAIIERIGANARAVLVDRDANATRALAGRFGAHHEVIHASFLEAAERFKADGTQADMVLLDLGVSSPQFDNGDRGFSFKRDAALDMRMDQSQQLTAAVVVNTYREQELARIIHHYGEEPKSQAVARAIVAGRPYGSTFELAKVVRTRAVKPKDIDAATKTFQAIRIEVNAELFQLKQALPIFGDILAPGGRLAVISFHSLEDRIVKQFFTNESRDCICPPKQPICTCGHTASLTTLTPRPIVADSTETAINPRARSAKLRAAEKQNQNQRRQ